MAIEPSQVVIKIRYQGQIQNLPSHELHANQILQFLMRIKILNNQINREIMKCMQDDDCSWLFHCSSSFQCQHNSVFPLSVYTILIYLTIPIACGLVNSTGHSMGLFKVLIVIAVLGYQGIQATMINQALNVGTALPNYFSMLVRKHPTMPTSLVNFNLVYILVPCCLLGSTMGSLLVQFIPNLIQQILTFLVFSYFAWGFYQKYRKIKQKQTELKNSILTDASEILTDVSDSVIENSNKQEQIADQQQTSQHEQQAIGTTPLLQEPLLDGGQPLVEKISQEFKDERKRVMEYEKSIHFKDITFSILVFVVFQFIVFLVQGRLPFLQFSHCNWKYWVGVSLLIPLTLCYLKFIHNYLRQKFDSYERLQIKQEIMLNKNSQFFFILAAGLLAGLVQGMLGLGSGSCMMSFLLTKPINTTSASATAGYQVLFIGLAALIEGFINHSVDLSDTVFFIVLCFVLGGAVTLAMAWFLQKQNHTTVSKIVVLIAGSLSLVSVIMVVPDVVKLINTEGITKAMEVKFSCDQ